MVHTTDTAGATDIASFYDALAPDYDAMTSMEKRFVVERPFFQMLVDRFAIRTALDAGCGTGFHALLLSKLGVAATGIDVSREMMVRAREHAKEFDLQARFYNLSFQEVGARSSVEPFSPAGGFDAVFCMGNSFAHLLDPGSLNRTLRGFADVLRPGGILFAQTLNYDRILSQRDRIQSIREEGKTIFVRYYEYCGELIQFNILTLKRSGPTVGHTLNTVTLRPILREDIAGALAGTSFGNISVFGSIAMDAFDPVSSRDLVVLAQKILVSPQ
jgi:SAM-dependent methyltransferase